MISALAFNDGITPTTTDARAAGENFAKVFRKINAFSPLTGSFQAKTAVVQFDSLTVSAASSSGHVIEAESHHSHILVLPFSGRYSTMIDGVEYRYHADRTVFFSSCDKRRSMISGSGVVLQLKATKLSQTFFAMFGSRYPADFSPKNQVISLENTDISFLELFKSLFAQIDLVGIDPNVLSKFALDDSFYRLCVGLLYPDIFLAVETRNGKRPYVRPEIERLCEYMAAHLTDAFSLTRMESMSGLSARILQLSFQQSFGFSPKQWMRKQRLHAARRVMLNRGEPISIKALAYDFCFASPSDFAHHYALEFGELPSHTLGRKLSNVSAKSSIEFGK